MITEKTQQLFLHYLAASALLGGLGFGVYQHWWAPSIFEALLISALAALGVGQSVIYGARNLTANPTPPKEG